MKRILLMLLLVAPLVMAYSNEQQAILDTDINITIVGYYVDSLNDSFFNITIVTEDETWVKTNIDNKTNIVESYEIDMIRKLNCNETDVYSLTKQCKDFFTEFDSYESLVSTIANLNESKKRCLIDLNESVSKKDYYSDYQSCLATKKELNDDLTNLQKDCDEDKNIQIFFIIGAFLLGVGGCYWYYFIKGKPKPQKTHFEKDRGSSYPTHQPKASWEDDINKLGGGKPQ